MDWLAFQFSDPTNFIVNAVSLGGIYALIAVGYTMVYGIVKLINFAHGDVFMLSAFVLLTLLNDPNRDTHPLSGVLDGHYIALAALFAVTSMLSCYALLRNRLSWSALCGVMILLGGLSAFGVYYGAKQPVNFWMAFPFTLFLVATFGVSLDWVAYRPLRNAPRLAPLISAIGCSIIIFNFANVIWGSTARSFEQSYLPVSLKKDTGTWMHVSYSDITIVVTAVLTMAVLYVLVNKTKLGKAMRAVSLDYDASRLMGIDIDKTIAATFAIGSVIAAVGGLLYGVRMSEVKTPMGTGVGIIAFSSAVLGGIGSIPGAVLGGFFIAFVFQIVSYSDHLFDVNWNVSYNLDAWLNAIAYVVLIVFLIFRPQGILGKKSVDRA